MDIYGIIGTSIAVIIISAKYYFDNHTKAGDRKRRLKSVRKDYKVLLKIAKKQQKIELKRGKI